MALDFSGVDTQARVNALVAKLNALDAEEAALASSGSLSDQGRTENNAATLAAIAARRKSIREELALMAGPVFQVSRMRS